MPTAVHKSLKYGAAAESRTPDLPLTKTPLYGKTLANPPFPKNSFALSTRENQPFRRITRSFPGQSPVTKPAFPFRSGIIDALLAGLVLAGIILALAL